MAEQTVNAVASALTGELTNRVFSGLIKKFGKQTATSEKLQRLEMLLIKTHSAVEASEKYAIKNLWLLQWRDKLKEATSQGDEVLASFRWQAEDAEATSSASANQQQGEASSCTGAATVTATGALSFTRNYLFGMVQDIRNTSHVLFSGDEDLEKLNSTLARFEMLSPDIGEFIRVLQLEAPLLCWPYWRTSHRTWKTPTKLGQKKRRKLMLDIRKQCSERNSKPLFSFSLRNDEKMEEMSAKCIEEKGEEKLGNITTLTACNSEEETENNFRIRLSVVSQKEPKGMLREDKIEEMQGPLEKEQEVLASCVDLSFGLMSGVTETKYQEKDLQYSIEAALVKIFNAIEQAGSHNIQDLEWLVRWAGILMEAKEQGCIVLSAIRESKSVNAEDTKESMVEYGQEIDSLGSFVHRLEGLARDAEYFNNLVYLCPEC